MSQIINDFDGDGFHDADLDRDGIVTPEELLAYRKHIVHFFDKQLGNDILNLSPEDKCRCFQMIQDYADILEKLFHPGIDILEHVQGKRFAAAKADPHEGINWEYDCPIIREYDAWKASKS
jgi:phosphoglucomutase